MFTLFFILFYGIAAVAAFAVAVTVGIAVTGSIVLVVTVVIPAIVARFESFLRCSVTAFAEFCITVA